MKYLCALRDLVISLVASTIIIYGLNIIAGFAGADYNFSNGEVFIIWILMAILVNNCLKNRFFLLMKKIFTILLFILFSIINSFAACDDPLGDGVDYSFCQFSEEQDLSRAYAPNSNLSFISFIKVNLDKSILMNSNLSNGNFAEASFFRANLYEANLRGWKF